MHNPEKISWTDGTDYTLEYEVGGVQGQCLHCNKKYKSSSYLKYQHQNHCKSIQHRTTFADQISIKDYLLMSDKDKEEPTIIKIVKYLCENAHSINSTQTQSFKNLFGASYSEETIRKAIIDYADKLKEETKMQIKNLIVSIVIDGATINENSGWYAIGLATREAIYFYDIYHLSTTTTTALTHAIYNIIKEIEEDTGAVVFGACSDNAPNIAHVFDPDHPEGLAKVHKKYLLRVPCQAHTANLVNASYERTNLSYSRLRSKIKNFASKASEKNIHIALNISTRCPLIRDQRWFTEYDALKWIIENREKIENSYNSIKEIIGIGICPIQDSWNLLYEALCPLRQYVTCVEANICSIGRSWDHFRKMEEELTSLSSSNKYAKDLLQIVHIRWSSTSDANFLHLASFVGPAKLVPWKANYRALARKFEHGGMSQEDKDKFQTMKAESDLMVKTTIKYAKCMGFNFDGLDSTISFVLTTATLSMNRIDEYYWEGLGISSSNTAFEASKKGIDIIPENVTEIARFYCRLRSLPSSEAFCERIFANMRLLFPDSRYSCNDDLIRAQTLIRMVMSLKYD